jgi:hypothetical protein
MSDGIWDSFNEDDYDTKVRRGLMRERDNLKNRLTYLEKFDYHLSSEKLQNLLNVTSKLYHKYKLFSDEKKKSKQKKYLPEIKELLNSFNQLIPDEKLKYFLGISNLEKKISSRD